MRSIFYAAAFLFICFFLLFKSNFIEKNEVSYKTEKVEKITEEKSLNDDAKTINKFLSKFIEDQIKEENFINKHFINKTLGQISKQLAVYFNQIMKFQDDPDKSIKMVNDIIDNSQAYIEAGAIYLEQLKAGLTRDYEEIKNKYCIGFFELLFNDKSWKQKATLNEIEKINELESQLTEVNSVLKVLNRIRILFTLIDWTSYSNSPLAWIARKFVGI